MLGLGVVTPLLRLLHLAQALGQGRKLPIGLAAGPLQVAEGPPHEACMHFGEVEVRLLVNENGAPLHAVPEHDGLDPGLAGPESGDDAELEGVAAALRSTRRGSAAATPSDPSAGGSPWKS